MRVTTAICKTLTIGCCVFAPDCPAPRDKALTGCCERATTLSMTAGRFLLSSHICSGIRLRQMRLRSCLLCAAGKSPESAERTLGSEQEALYSCEPTPAC